MDNQLTKIESDIVVAKPPEQQATVFANQFDLAGMAITVGTLKTTKEEHAILFAPVVDSEVAVRPDDGIVYVPHIFYTKRWTQAWGSEWGLLPQGLPAISNPDAKGNGQIIWGWHLIVKGKYIAFAVGGQKYVASNPKMSYDDAAEGAKSNAIMRLGKSFGMFSELWDQTWREPWAAKNIEAYEGTNWKNERVKMYRRKTAEQMQPITNALRAELIARWQGKHPDSNLLQAFDGLDAYWVKSHKHPFSEALLVEAQALIAALDEKESKEATKAA